MSTDIRVDDHPLLSLSAFEAELPAALGQLPTPDWLSAWLALEPTGDAPPLPGERDEGGKTAVRSLLRHGGFRPSGRSKPACEYLLKVAAGDGLSPINLAVDLCNAVSLHSGLPISVVDAELVTAPLSVAVVPKDAERQASRYVFNASGQELDLRGLLCLHDAHGPCASPVKDSQRSKTHDDTRRLLCLVWGSRELAERTTAATAWYRALSQQAGLEIREG